MDFAAMAMVLYLPYHELARIVSLTMCCDNNRAGRKEAYLMF